MEYLDLVDGSANGALPHNQKTSTVAQVLAFKQIFDGFLLREVMYDRAPVAQPDLSDDAGQFTGSSSPQTTLPLLNLGKLNKQRSVLTFNGTGSQAKQLFSSLQKRQTVQFNEPSETNSTTPPIQPSKSVPSTSSIELLTPLSEGTLPQGISVTSILPVHTADDIDNIKRAPSLKDCFPPPSNQTPLDPPRPSKRTITKGPVVRWYKPSEAEWASKHSYHGPYSTQPLRTGQWLGYSGSFLRLPNIPIEVPEETLRQKGAALNIMEPKASGSTEYSTSGLAEEEGLFRRVFSSFAPSYDDSASVVPTAVRSQVWWARVGERRFRRTYSAEGLSEKSTATLESERVIEDNTDEDEQLRETVEQWVPEEPPSDFTISDASELTKPMVLDEGDMVLSKIQELLEIVSSYHRVRNSSLPSSSSSAIPNAHSISNISGTPSSPSSAELEIFNMLKEQLAILVAALPPHAAAKLNGDQLAEINISTTFPAEGKSYSGTMEEQSATPSPAPYYGLQSRATPGGTPYTSQYNFQRQPSYGSATTPRIPQPSQTSLQTPTQFSPGRRPPMTSPTLNRTLPVNNFQKQDGSSAHRSYSQTLGLSDQIQYSPTKSSRRATQQNYTAVEQNQRLGSYSERAGQVNSVQRPSQPQYQQAAQERQQTQQTNATRLSDSTPQNMSTLATPSLSQTYTQHQRTSSNVATPTPTPRANPSTPVPPASGTSQSTSTPAASTLGASGFHTYLTPEEQESMMERQRAQLAVQMNKYTKSVSPQPPPSTQPGAQASGRAVPLQTSQAGGERVSGAAGGTPSKQTEMYGVQMKENSRRPNGGAVVEATGLATKAVTPAGGSD